MPLTRKVSPPMSRPEPADPYRGVALLYHRLLTGLILRTVTHRGSSAGEELVFNPWQSLAAHQPLGGINRLRKPVYLSSAEHRGA